VKYHVVYGFDGKTKVFSPHGTLRGSVTAAIANLRFGEMSFAIIYKKRRGDGGGRWRQISEFSYDQHTGKITVTS